MMYKIIQLNGLMIGAWVGHTFFQPYGFAAMGIWSGAALGFLLATWSGALVVRQFDQLIARMNTEQHRVTPYSFGAALGGAMIAALTLTSFRTALEELGWLGLAGALVLIVTCGAVVMRIAQQVPRDASARVQTSHPAERAEQEAHKLLDTSVIIDGRIADLVKTGFIEGTLVIPEFVLEELQHIADSPDMLKRNRGRRGLDILNKIQKELDAKVLIHEGMREQGEVDMKLLKLARLLNGKVVTNDYNLNKVCELQGVPVLNINDLANAIKPIVLPGEEMVVQVVKDGKEYGQGVAYLNDGTMIVVENGREHMSNQLEVIVTSVLQTSAGRMIFAKPKLLEKVL